MRDAEFAGVLGRSSAVLLCLALQNTETVEGVFRIWRLEREGLARPVVLRYAERRIEQIGGTEKPGGAPSLIVTGRAVDTDERAWERRRVCLS